jgi:hypothetical protein
MKRIIVFGCLLCLFLGTRGQNYIQYHLQIGDAEAAILESDFQTALEIYDSTFAVYGFRFWRDCYTAARCAQANKDLPKARYYLERGVEIGMRPKFVFKQRVLAPVLDGRFKKQLRKAEREVFRARIDKEYRDEIAVLGRLDQKTRKGNMKNPKFGIEMRQGDSICGNTFMHLVEEKGYPNVIQIGYSRKVASVPSIILWHGAVTIGGRSYYDEYFRGLLLREVEKGRMSPRDFAISEDRHTFGTTCYGSIGTMGLDLTTSADAVGDTLRLSVPSVAPCSTAEIDAARRSIGLESTEMLAAKRENKDGFFLDLFK